MSKSEVRILHNPRCSKSRQSLALLEENGVIPDVVHYLETPPNADELGEILDLLGMSPRDLMRKGEVAYHDNKLDDDSLNRETLIAAMVDNPILIERPIVIANGKAIIGRPPEQVLEILRD